MNRELVEKLLAALSADGKSLQKRVEEVQQALVMVKRLERDLFPE